MLITNQTKATKERNYFPENTEEGHAACMEKVFDEWFVSQPEEVQEQITGWLRKLVCGKNPNSNSKRGIRGMGLVSAKELLVKLFLHVGR